MAIDLGPMTLERDTVLEIIAAVVPTVLLIALLMVIGTRYSADGTLTPDGGTAIVGAMVLFVVVMTGVGLWLTRAKSGGQAE